MFNPSRADARRFFFETWGKYRSQMPLEGLERTAMEIILLHPEHHALLDDAQRNLERDFSPESGAVNPFLHLSLHLAIAEQLSIDQPRGIQAAYRELASRADLVLVEGAGGFLVPLSDNESMALIPSALQLPVVVVVGMRLGCINHALLTAEAIHSRGLTLAGWVANTLGETMNAYAENLSTLQRRMEAPLIGEITRVQANSTLAAARLASSHLNTELLIPATESK